MPTYSYACTSCDHRFDTVQAFTDSSLTECPECSGRLRKLFSSVGIVFKGSGFYRTDSRAKPEGDGKSDAGKSDAKADSSSGNSEKSESTSGASEGGSGDAKGSSSSSRGDSSSQSSKSSGSSGSGTSGSSGSSPSSSGKSKAAAS